MLTRMGEAKDWGTGLPLKADMLGRMHRLEMHHIFPKSRLYDAGYGRAQVNAVANFCFLTKDTNLAINNRLPEIYFEEVEEAHRGALASQWIPMDRALWRVERYPDFLEARKSCWQRKRTDASPSFCTATQNGSPRPRPQLPNPH